MLLNRDAVLTEQTSSAFAEEHGLHLFMEDQIAVNRSIVFKIETFEPTDSFKPARPHRTRLKWSDTTGAEQSKLFVTAPETVISEILDAKVEVAAELKGKVRRPARGRSGSRRMEAFRS